MPSLPTEPKTSPTKRPSLRVAFTLAALATGLAGPRAFAQPAAAPAPAATAPAAAPAPLPADDDFNDKLLLETGRYELPPADPTGMTLSLHGEYQLRYHAQSDLRLQPPARHPEATTLGQNHYLYHWLRLNPRFRYRDKIQVVGQIDIPRGLIVGDTTQFVDRARDALDDQRWYEVHPRYLYVEWSSPIGVVRLGQQGAYWGMGLLANDGDHPSLFGDYARGSLAERVLFATTPMGKGTPLTVVLAGDLVFEDNTADLLDGDDPSPGHTGKIGDRALQGVLAALWRKKRGEIGLYGAVRSQDRDKESIDALTPYTEKLTVGVVDMTAKLNGQVPGSRAFLYGQFEWAYVFGSTNYVRSNYGAPLDPGAAREDERIRTFGAAATLGAVTLSGDGADRFGRFVAELEWGWASGDADPMDGTTKRFTFDPNHNVGLVLFDQVLAWKTARAATIAQDKEIVNRASPGLQFLPSKGGVFGATYLNPRFVYRPKRFLDLKGGAVIAQTTADFVDPYHVGALGNYANYDGGDDLRHDLGLELDLGFDARVKVDKSTTVQFGAEGGVLFPGHAFDDAKGQGLDNQYVGVVKLGLQY